MIDNGEAMIQAAFAAEERREQEEYDAKRIYYYQVSSGSYSRKYSERFKNWTEFEQWIVRMNTPQPPSRRYKQPRQELPVLKYEALVPEAGVEVGEAMDIIAPSDLERARKQMERIARVAAKKAKMAATDQVL